MFDDPVSDEGSGVILPPVSDDASDGLVLQFPVEIEVRLVAPYDPERLVDVALDRFTTALRGLA